MLDKYFGYYTWFWYMVWMSLCLSLVLSHFHKELHKGRGGQSCDTKGSKLSRCFNGNYTSWIWIFKKRSKMVSITLLDFLKHFFIQSVGFFVLFLFGFFFCALLLYICCFCLADGLI